MMMRHLADRVFAIALGRNVGPPAFLTHHGAHSISIVGAVGQNHLAVAQVAQQLSGGLDVVGLARRNGDLHRQTALVGQSMGFRSKTAPASSKTSIRVAFLKWRPRDAL
jgi:hypothetical protein